MGVKLMTGATGEQNIQAADDRECLAGITGLDSYVFPTGSRLKATLVDANTVTIGTGAGSIQGSRFRCSTTTTVTIQSGTQGQYRRDVIGLHFSRETSGREGLEFQVLTGDPASSDGAASDPSYTKGDLLKGDAEAFMPLYRVKLSGINAADPEPLFSVLTPLADLGDSVSRTANKLHPMSFIYPGTTVDQARADDYGQVISLMTKDTFKRICGRYFDQSKDVVVAMNGDYVSQKMLHSLYTYYSPASGGIWARFEGVSVGSSVRINWLIVLGA